MRVQVLVVVARDSEFLVAAFRDPFQPVGDLFVQRPHPFRRDLLVGQMLVPVENPQRMFDRVLKINWDLFYRGAFFRPEAFEVAGGFGASDEGEEPAGAGKSFPSVGSTLISRYARSICSRTFGCNARTSRRSSK